MLKNLKITFEDCSDSKIAQKFEIIEMIENLKNLEILKKFGDFKKFEEFTISNSNSNYNSFFSVTNCYYVPLL